MRSCKLLLLPLVAVSLVLAGCSSVETQSAATPVLRAEPAIAPPLHRGLIYPDDAPSIYASSAIMIDADSGETIYEKNADQLRPVASTQKLVTALLVTERGGLDDYVTVAASDTRVEPSKLGLRSGERYTRRNLLASLLVKSCNDSAACLARDHSGSVSAFAASMNRKAYSLGARHSHFVNPHGLTAPGQRSTARDMARISFAAYHNSTIRHYARMPEFHFRLASGRVARLEATNKLLERSSMYNGLKTGYTVASGRTLVTSANIGGREIIIVQLGSKTKHIFDDADRLARWAKGRSNIFFAGE